MPLFRGMVALGSTTFKSAVITAATLTVAACSIIFLVRFLSISSRAYGGAIDLVFSFCCYS